MSASARLMTMTCYARLFKNFTKVDNVCKSHRKLHMLTSKSCRSLLEKVDYNVVVYRRISAEQLKGGKSTLMYLTATGILMLGMSYAAVPLYRIFCQATGRGGTAVKDLDVDKIETMTPVKSKQLTIEFNADKASNMQWQFRPQQHKIKVVPGETALAFYKAKNPTDKPIIGISTYNILPFEAGLYFNKIQCFCFEEQRLNPHEEVDMPVFFYIDPDFMDDPAMEKVDTIVLSYTFFEAKPGQILPYPGYQQQH